MQANFSLRPVHARRHPLAFALALALPALPTLAQQADDNAARLQRVEVLGHSAAQGRQPGDRGLATLAPDALPAAGQHLDARDLANTNIGRDISNLFRRIPGVLANNIDQGETGNGFRMRGFATQGTHGADTAVHVDGVPQNIPSSQGGAGHGPVFLEWLSADMIASVDVVKGPVSALFGDQNRAGAVDIRTRDGGAATPSSLTLSAERHGLKRASLLLSHRLADTVDSLLVADLYRNDGYRHASHTERDTLFWKLSLRHDDARYSLRLLHYSADFGAAGYLLLPDLEKGLDPRSTQAGNPGFGDARRTSLVFNRAPARAKRAGMPPPMPRTSNASAASRPMPPSTPSAWTIGASSARGCCTTSFGAMAPRWPSVPTCARTAATPGAASTSTACRRPTTSMPKAWIC